VIERDQRLAGVLRRSLIVQTPIAVIDHATAAARDSTIIQSLRGAVTASVPASAAGRLRWTAVMIACAAAAHQALRSLLPAYTVSALPWWWSAMVVLAALAIAASAPGIAAAWRSSSPSRLMSWLTGG
jgi:hypothetical protein